MTASSNTGSLNTASLNYERLFQLNRCLEQVAEILEQFRQEGLVHPVFASDRRRNVEDLRADLSHVLTGLLHQRELEACVAAVKIVPRKDADGEKSGEDDPD
jgi:hypothetical protein